MVCKKCKMDIPDGAKVCHHCGAKQGIGCGTAILVIFIIGVVLSALAGIGRGARQAEQQMNTPQQTTASTTTAGTTTGASQSETDRQVMNGFVIGDKQGEINDGMCRVIGVIGNGTGKDCEAVTITIGFYSESGVKVTSGVDTVLNLRAGESWQYEVLAMGSNIATYKIDDIEWF